MKFIFQPVVDDNNHIVLYIFSSNNENPEFITDPNVELCGSLRYYKPDESIEYISYSFTISKACV